MVIDTLIVLPIIAVIFSRRRVAHIASLVLAMIVLSTFNISFFGGGHAALLVAFGMALYLLSIFDANSPMSLFLVFLMAVAVHSFFSAIAWTLTVGQIYAIEFFARAGVYMVRELVVSSTFLFVVCTMRYSILLTHHVFAKE